MKIYRVISENDPDYPALQRRRVLQIHRLLEIVGVAILLFGGVWCGVQRNILLAIIAVFCGFCIRGLLDWIAEDEEKIHSIDLYLERQSWERGAVTDGEGQDGEG